MIRIGIIGLSVHSEDFTKIINGGQGTTSRNDCRVTTLYHPPGNPDVEFSTEKLKKFSDSIQSEGVRMVSSIKKVIKESDAIMLLTNDGRPHLKEVLPVLKAGKPVYIDKPMAESLENVTRIFKEAARLKTPVFTSSALRYVKNAQLFSRGEIVGAVQGAETHGPAPLQKSHTDLFWDGIHSVELLFTVMGRGCKEVIRVYSDGSDVVTGFWEGGRTGLFRGLRSGKVGFGGTVFGEKQIAQIGGFDGYEGLVDAILNFFRTKTAPVSPAETLEIYAFMHAADISKQNGGRRVTIEVPNI